MAKTATTEMRRCIGSKTFGIEPHEAPVADFPVQPKSRDGYGPMCKPHWTEYTRALRKARVAREGAAVRAHNEAMDERRTPAPGSLDAGEAAALAGAVDAAIGRETKRAKAPTKRERRRTPMAHLPTTTEEVEQTIREVLAE